MAALLLSTTAVAAEDYYSGHYHCGDGPEHAYVIASDEAFSIYRRSPGERDYRGMGYSGPLAAGEIISATRNGFDGTIEAFAPDGFAIRWTSPVRIAEACDPFTVSEQPAPLATYEELRDYAAVAKPSPDAAREIDSRAENLAPVGLLPRLDQASLPRATYDAVAGYWDRHLDHYAEVARTADVADGEAAETLMVSLRDAFPIDAGPGGNLAATQPFLDAFGRIVEVAANRIEAAGHAVAPMTSVDDDTLCQIVDDGRNRTRTDDLQHLFGLPYVHWDRQLVEATIAKLETCERFGHRKADALADHYPRILALKEARVAQVAARTAADDKVQQIEDRIAEIEALPPTAESHFETRGYANEFGRPPRDPAIREAMARYREVLHDRQLASISILSRFYADNLGFEDAEILADD
ncbi:hypothetical protein JQC91_08740 [Jannaschia sp. Os4]|uniref:hypothetical protein n=1 Tax=Jannaschia sp. Os4 TaxID=2807617 RepID=UPI00193AC217|nr:hypothetical protein [Jannaschia sp. Os4]MBM2576393.1 hypothetical protein [Jannaschia sp. Os4]